MRDHFTRPGFRQVWPPPKVDFGPCDLEPPKLVSATEYHDRKMQSRQIEGGPLAALLANPGPRHLYHYTGPSGLVGILNSRTIWAGRPADMNDSTEQALASKYAVEMLSHLEFPERSFGEGMLQYALELLSTWRGRNKGSRSYTVSLTSERDSLEQWRAYCPRSGGVALGFPVSHLRKVAKEQGFLLAPCVYDEGTHRTIVQHIVHFHLRVWEGRRSLAAPRQGISSHLVRALITDLDRFAPLLKHPSFAAEREWRLISPLMQKQQDDLIHIATETGLKLFRSFSLVTAKNPSIPTGMGYSNTGSHIVGFHAVMGPNINPDGMEEAILSLIPKEFGWQYSVARTSSPYR